MVVGAGAAETPKGAGAAANGALSITTDPVNAEVFVDGRSAGQTPTNLVSIPAGEHRVRVVKTGYLENARVVTVAAGQPTVVNVKLTKTSAATVSEGAGQVSSTGGGGGGSKKWLWVGLAGGGAAAAIAAVALTKNDPPVPGTISVSPTGTGMAGVTSFTIRATGASDPDKDPLTFNWRFSDNTTATGESVTKTFANVGTFQVNLDVSDGKHTAAAPAASVTVAPSLAGNWTGGTEGTFGCGIGATLSQTQTTLGGSLPLSGACTGSINLASGSTGGLTHPASVTLTSTTFTFTTNNNPPCPSSQGGCPGLVWTFTGSTDAAGTSMNGTITLRQGGGQVNTNNTTLRKQ